MTLAIAPYEPRYADRVRDWRAMQPRDVEGYPPPFDDEAEALVVRAIFVMPGFLERISPPLEAGHFFAPRNAAVFGAAVEERAEHGAITPSGVLARLKAQGHDPKADDVRALRVSEFLQNAEVAAGMTPAEVEQVIGAANTVYQLAMQRALALHCQQAVAQIYAGEVVSNRQFFAEFEARASELARTAARTNAMVDGTSAIDGALKEIGRKDGDLGISSGFPAYDREAGLLRGKEYTIVGAYTGDGKTAWGLAVAGNVALRGGGVHYVSIDMEPPELMLRLACAWATVKARRALEKKLDGDEWERLLRARELIQRKTRISIDHSRSMTVQEVDAQVRRQKLALEREGKKLRLVVVDYVQQLGFIGASKQSSENQVLVAVSEYLKTIAQKHDVHVLGLVQTWPVQAPAAGKGGKKTGGDQGDGKPDLQHIQGAKQIAKPASTAVFIHRKKVEGEYPERGPAELVVRKGRWSARKSIPMIFDGPLMRFETDEEAERRNDYGDRT